MTLSKSQKTAIVVGSLTLGGLIGWVATSPAQPEPRKPAAALVVRAGAGAKRDIPDGYQRSDTDAWKRCKVREGDPVDGRVSAQVSFLTWHGAHVPVVDDSDHVSVVVRLFDRVTDVQIEEKILERRVVRIGELQVSTLDYLSGPLPPGDYVVRALVLNDHRTFNMASLWQTIEPAGR